MNGTVKEEVAKPPNLFTTARCLANTCAET